MLEPVEPIHGALLLLPLLQLRLLLLRNLEPSRRRVASSAARDGDEAVFVGDRAEVRETPVALCLLSVELREESVCRGL